jgi:phosphopantetheinyl transferase
MLKDKEDKNIWLTRFWVSKEAYGKLIGKGLNGNPRQYKVSDIDGDKLTIENTVIHTILLNNYIIGYTI